MSGAVSSLKHAHTPRSTPTVLVMVRSQLFLKHYRSRISSFLRRWTGVASCWFWMEKEGACRLSVDAMDRVWMDGANPVRVVARGAIHRGL